MAGNSKGRSFWYGCIEAGERSSPVLRDDRLQTGNPQSVYLFNLQRGEIIEYMLAIVVDKLRELKPDEAACIDDLEAGYKQAKRNFSPRAARVRNVPVAKIVPLRGGADRSEDSDVDGDDDADAWLGYDEA